MIPGPLRYLAYYCDNMGIEERDRKRERGERERKKERGERKRERKREW